MTTTQVKDNRKWFILAGSTLLYLATDADGPNFNAALPAIQDYFNANSGQIQLLTSIAGLLVAALVLAAGAIGDLYGRKRTFLVGGIGLIIALLLQAFAPSMGFLTAMRGLDGVFSAITTPLAISLITIAFVGNERGLALGIFTAAVAFGEAFLPMLSGWLSDTFGWRSIFIIAISAAALACFFIFRYATESKNPNLQKLDWGGVILSAFMMVAFVGSFLLAGSRGFTDPLVLLCMVAAVVFLLIFVWWERRTPQPALNLDLFRDPLFRGAFLVGFGLYFVYVPMNPIMQIYFQDVLKYSALAASAALIPLSLGTALAGPFAGKLTKSLGSRISILIGIGAMLVGALLLVTLSSSPSYWIIALGLGIFAIGYGLANPPRTDTLMSAAPDDNAGAASSANSMGTEGGSAAGTALGMTLAIFFSTQAVRRLGSSAGLSSDQISQAADILQQAINEGVTTFPGVSQATLDQLFEGARTAASTGIGQTMLFMAVVLVICGLFVWFGMRKSTKPAAS